MTKRSHRRQQKAPRICIFCKKKPCTKEHIWPEWAHSLLPRPEPRQNVEVLYVQGAPNVLKSADSQTRDGNVQTKKIRVVCKSCNSGWMSGLEEEVIPILTPMIRGEKIILTPEKQTILARWIAMKVMVGEHNHPKDAVTSYAERNQFKETMQIPANMNIWLGWCGQGGWATAYFRETHTVSRTLTPAPEEIASKNMQEIAFGIGQLFIHIFHTTVAETGIEFNINPEAILRLWPLNGGDFVWPPEIRMNVMEANNVRTLIQQILGSPNVLWLSAPVPRPLIFGS